jgi:hypothetical protein
MSWCVGTTDDKFANRGLPPVKVQYPLLGVVVNCKRIVRLVTAVSIAQPA